MSLSKGSVDTLIGLAENKLDNIEVFDREDAQEVAILERAKAELYAMAGRPLPRRAGNARPAMRSPRIAAFR